MASARGQRSASRARIPLLLAVCAGAWAVTVSLLQKGSRTFCLARGTTRVSRGRATCLAAVQKCEGEAFIDDAIAGTGSGGVLVLSFSTTWCGPCKLMDPKVAELSETFAEGARFVKIVGDRDPDGMQLMKREKVRSVPQYHIYKGGEKVACITGAKYDDLKASLELHVGR